MIDPTEDLLHRGLLPRLDHRVNGMTADRLPAEVVAHAAAETAEWAAYVLDACACCCPDGPPTYGAPGWSRRDGDHKIALVASQIAAPALVVAAESNRAAVAVESLPDLLGRAHHGHADPVRAAES